MKTIAYDNSLNPSLGRPSVMRRAMVALAFGLLVSPTGYVGAQEVQEVQETQERRATTGTGFELLASSGALLPTGGMRGALRNAPVSTIQLSYAIRPWLAVTSVMGWARSRDLATVGAPKLSVFTYDVGVEARAPRWLAGKAGSISPFAGVGAGGRSYNHRGLDVAATHTVAGYAAAGAEIGRGRVALRLEGRDYVSGLRPLVTGGRSVARNDVMVMAGLRLTRGGN